MKIQDQIFKKKKCQDFVTDHLFQKKSSLAKESRVGKDHSPSERLSYYFHCQFLIHPVNYPCCIHFTNVNPSFRFLIKRILDKPPCYIPWVQSP